mgnify:CR=1 FL=1
MVELEVEREMDRSQAADFLRRLADELEGTAGSPDIGEGTTEPETMTVVVGDQSATVALPDRLALDVEIESRSPLLESAVEQSIELELTWDVEELPEDEAIEVV